MKFEDLSPELQEKAEACETAESEGVDLSDEDLDGVAGGVSKKTVLRPKPRILKKDRPTTTTQPQADPQTAAPTTNPLANTTE